MKAFARAPTRYALVDHTADLGIRIWGVGVAEVLANAATALADLLYDPADVAEIERREVQLVEADSETLLVRWLNELIVLREVDEYLWRSVELDWLPAGRLEAVLRGERFDPSRHAARTGLKAATYHRLRLKETGRGEHEAEIVFDV